MTLQVVWFHSPLFKDSLVKRTVRASLRVGDGSEVIHHTLCLVLELHVQFVHVQLFVLEAG